MDQGRRLDGWKEIAAYLCRDVRTAQRWEKELDLPVRRIGGPGRPSIFALTEEIDGWLKQQDEEAIGTPAHSGGRRLLVWLSVGLAGLVALAWGWSRLSDQEAQLSRKDWLLIIPFDNKTGNQELDDLFEASLRRQLINTGYSRIVSAARSRDALQMLDLPLDQRIDIDVARRIAEVDEGIRLLLAGALRQSGGGVSVEIDLLEAVSGQVIRETSQSVPTEDLGRGVDRLASWINGELGSEGGDSIRGAQAGETTPSDLSLRAIKLYTLGLAALHQDDRPTAEQFFRDVIEEEPEFASAYIYLAWVMRSRGGDYLSLTNRALELANGAPDPERYFILGSHAHMTGDYSRAIPYYEALLLLAPDHFWGCRNLLYLAEQVGDWERAVQLSYQLVEFRPLDYLSNRLASRAAAAWAADFPRARLYVERIQEASARNPRLGEDPSWVRNFEIFEAWYRDDLETVQVLLDEFAAEVGSTSGIERREVIWRGGFWYLTLGQFQAAERLFQLAERENYHVYMAISALFQDDGHMLARHTEAFWNLLPQRLQGTVSMLSAHAGSRDRTETILAELLNDPLADRSPAKAISLFKGAAAAARGEAEAAIQHLQKGLVGNPNEHRWLIAWLLLADLLRDQGRLDEAIQQLQRVPRSFVFPWGAPFWVMGRIKLAALARESNNRVLVSQLEKELSRLLERADQEFRLHFFPVEQSAGPGL